MRLTRTHIEKLNEAIQKNPNMQIEVYEGEKDGRIFMMAVEVKETLIPLSKVKDTTEKN